MHEKYHLLSAVPFILLGEYEVALGCVLPDVTWLPTEIRYRLSKTGDWHTWSTTLTQTDILPYRITHSIFFWIIVSIYSPMLMLGAFIHIILDLPTHSGIMQQQPLYPIKWRWPWIIK